MPETKPKWNEQLHSHICPLHTKTLADRDRCAVIPCPEPYIRVCDKDHPREMIQKYVTESNRRHNEDIRDEQRAQREAYDAGRLAAIEEGDGDD